MFTMEEKSFPMGDLPRVIQENRIKQLAYEIVKYQNYKVKYATANLPGDLASSTKANYFICGVKFIKNGTKNKIVPVQLYEYITEAMNKHVQPLTPKESERRVERNINYTKRNVEHPAQKVLEIIKNQSPKVYAVKLDNTLVIQNTLNDARAFSSGINFLNPNSNASIVQLEITEVKDGI